MTTDILPNSGPGPRPPGQPFPPPSPWPNPCVAPVDPHLLAAEIQINLALQSTYDTWEYLGVAAA